MKGLLFLALACLPLDATSVTFVVKTAGPEPLSCTGYGAYLSRASLPLTPGTYAFFYGSSLAYLDCQNNYPLWYYANPYIYVTDDYISAAVKLVTDGQSYDGAVWQFTGTNMLLGGTWTNRSGTTLTIAQNESDNPVLTPEPASLALSIFGVASLLSGFAWRRGFRGGAIG